MDNPYELQPSDLSLNDIDFMVVSDVVLPGLIMRSMIRQMFFSLFLNVHLVHLSTNVFRSSVESNESKNNCLFAGLDAER